MKLPRNGKCVLRKCYKIITNVSLFITHVSLFVTFYHTRITFYHTRIMLKITSSCHHATASWWTEIYRQHDTKWCPQDTKWFHYINLPVNLTPHCALLNFHAPITNTLQKPCVITVITWSDITCHAEIGPKDSDSALGRLQITQQYNVFNIFCHLSGTPLVPLTYRKQQKAPL